MAAAATPARSNCLASRSAPCLVLTKNSVLAGRLAISAATCTLSSAASTSTLCSVTPIRTTSSIFARFCKVVETGEPLKEEFPVNYASVEASWLRSQVVRLGDGLAVTFSDISEAKATQERYAHLAEFTDSVFQNAPFSIVATDTNGLITAMNVAAEKLTGYSREELVGKAPLTVLHDERELLGKAS